MFDDEHTQASRRTAKASKAIIGVTYAKMTTKIPIERDTRYLLAGGQPLKRRPKVRPCSIDGRPQIPQQIEYYNTILHKSSETTRKARESPQTSALRHQGAHLFQWTRAGGLLCSARRTGTLVSDVTGRGAREATPAAAGDDRTWLGSDEGGALRDSALSSACCDLIIASYGKLEGESWD